MSTTQIYTIPERAWQLSRRELMRRVLGGISVAAALPLPGAISSQSEDFWRVVKTQFPMRRDLILMNAANLCPSPYPVLETVFGLTRDVDADASFQNRDKFDQLREASRQLLAQYLGAGPEEIAIVRNTSEANNTVINGLSLGPEDEVVVWDQNHPTNNVAWEVRAQRWGFSIKRVTTPPHPGEPKELMAPFRQALTAKTRVLAFTHVSNTTGVGLPAKELCHLAGERGILTLVDGAQTFGALQVDLHDMGCDFYTGSAHKWLVGPKEAGLLYLRKERLAGLWPSVVGSGWEGALEKGAQKFETLGQRDDAAVAAVGTAVEFHNAIGKARVEKRIHELASALKAQIRQIAGAALVTPVEPALSAGVVVFSLAGTDSREVFEKLYREHLVGAAALGGNVRLCPHIYNPMEEVDRVAGILRKIAKTA